MNTKNQRMLTVILGGLLTCSLSQALCPSAMAQELKVGYVNLGKVFDGYERTKVSDAELEKKGQQKDTELQGRLNELKKLREGLELLNDKAKESKTREIEQKADDLQRFKTNSVRELGRERQKLVSSIFEDIQQAIDEYAKAHDFSLILQQEKVILYGQSAYDVSDEILKLLNSRFKAKP